MCWGCQGHPWHPRFRRLWSSYWQANIIKRWSKAETFTSSQHVASRLIYNLWSQPKDHHSIKCHSVGDQNTPFNKISKKHFFIESHLEQLLLFKVWSAKGTYMLWWSFVWDQILYNNQSIRPKSKLYNIVYNSILFQKLYDFRLVFCLVIGWKKCRRYQRTTVCRKPGGNLDGLGLIVRCNI